MRTSTLNPDVREFIARFKASGRRPFQELTVAEARDLYRTSCLATAFRVDEPVAVENLFTDAEGARLGARIYRPGDRTTTAAPAILFIHGGGWVLGDLATHDALCRRLAVSANTTVISVEYRLAPEHPFPAAFLDVQCWHERLCVDAARFGIDPARLAIMGDSAGGTLAASLALALRERPEVAPPAQVLFYPVTDLSAESAGYARMEEGGILTAATMRWFRELYASPAQRVDWRCSPLLAPSLEDAAPALVVTARHDPLCEEGQAYARALEAAGVPTTLLHLGEQMHAILSLGGIIGSALAPLLYAAAFLKARLPPAIP